MPIDFSIDIIRVLELAGMTLAWTSCAFLKKISDLTNWQARPSTQSVTPWRASSNVSLRDSASLN